MINIKELKCNNCGASLTANPMINRAYCPYCTTNFVIESDSQSSWQNNSPQDINTEYQLVRDDDIRSIGISYREKMNDSDAPPWRENISADQLDYTYAFLSYLSHNLLTNYNTGMFFRYENVSQYRVDHSFFRGDYKVKNTKKEDIIPDFYKQGSNGVFHYLKNHNFNIWEPNIYSNDSAHPDEHCRYTADISAKKTISPDTYIKEYQYYQSMADRIENQPVFRRLIDDLFNYLSSIANDVKGGISDLEIMIEPGRIYLEIYPYPMHGFRFKSFCFHSKNPDNNYNMDNLPNMKMQAMFAAVYAKHIIQQTQNHGKYDWDLNKLCGPQGFHRGESDIFYFALSRRVEQKEVAPHYQSW